MERIKNLNIYQKALLIIMIVAVIVFSIIYPKTVARVGFLYNGQIFVPEVINGSTVYSGKLDRTDSRFVVTGKDTVEFYYGDTLYGPYIIVKDPSAVPKNHQNASSMTGIEVRCGERIVFRGGFWQLSKGYWYLYDEDGDKNLGHMSVDIGNRPQYTSNKDTAEPNIYTIIALTRNPELTHKGSMLILLGSIFLFALNTISILFIDEIFRFNLSFQINNPEDAEPSDFEIMGRYILWTMLTVIPIAFLIYGLQLVA
ncbi:MAG: hypothetical protein IKT81_03325 [Clostridia bacterium]|nr:hypothetical protein [Clostridia bacterium]